MISQLRLCFLKATLQKDHFFMIKAQLRAKTWKKNNGSNAVVTVDYRRVNVGTSEQLTTLRLSEGPYDPHAAPCVLTRFSQTALVFSSSNKTCLLDSLNMFTVSQQTHIGKYVNSKLNHQNCPRGTLLPRNSIISDDFKGSTHWPGTDNHVYMMRDSNYRITHLPEGAYSLC